MVTQVDKTQADTRLTPVPLLQLATGFWGSMVLASAVEVDLAGRLAGGRAVSVRELAAELEFPPRPAVVFVAACASLGLLERDGEKYRNSALAEVFLVPTSDHYFGGFVTFVVEREYSAYQRLTEALRTGRPLTWDPGVQESLFSAEDRVMLALFWQAMHSLSMFTATALADAVDLTGHTRLLDVGGGSGAFPITLCRRYPNLTATVLDLPHACEFAQARIRDAGLADTVDTIAADFLADEALPGGYDVMLLSHVLHDWDSATGRALLGKCWQALPSGGALVVCELMLNPERTGPPVAALMGINMLVETEGGENYSETELTDWLLATGFTPVQLVALGDAAGATGALLAHKP